MNKNQDLIGYIKTELAKYPNHFEWRIEVNPHHNAFFLRLFTFLENTNGDTYTDQNGQVFEGSFWFEQAIAFYPNLDTKIDRSRYLYTVSYNQQEGIQQGFIDNLLAHLRLVMNQLGLQFDDYQKGLTMMPLTIDWQNRNFKERISQAKSLGRYSYTMLIFGNEFNQSDSKGGNHEPVE